MSKRTKIWLITGISLVIIGLITFSAVMTSYRWDFTKLSTVKYISNTYQVTEAFESISIDTDTADIVFSDSDNSTCKVICYEQENVKHTVTVQDGTLTVSEVDKRKWYEHIGIAIESPKITVYLPSNEYNALSIKSSTGDIELPENFSFTSIDILTSTGDVKDYASASGSIKIKTDTGDISADNISANALEFSVATGKIVANTVTCAGDFKIKVSTGGTQLTDIKCNSLISSGSTGNISLKNVIANERFDIERSTGNVRFDSCDAAEIFVNTDTGNVTGNLLSEKVFIAESDTGNINVPKTSTGGRCEITTDTGDIRIILNSFK